MCHMKHVLIVVMLNINIEDITITGISYSRINCSYVKYKYWRDVLYQLQLY